jgi:hypothetical protein
MGKNRSNPKVRQVWGYDEYGTKGYNAFGAFEVVLVNLGIIDVDDIIDLEDTERFDEHFSTRASKQSSFQTKRFGERSY